MFKYFFLSQFNAIRQLRQTFVGGLDEECKHRCAFKTSLCLFERPALSTSDHWREFRVVLYLFVQTRKMTAFRGDWKTCLEQEFWMVCMSQ